MLPAPQQPAAVLPAEQPAAMLPAPPQQQAAMLPAPQAAAPQPAPQQQPAAMLPAEPLTGAAVVGDAAGAEQQVGWGTAYRAVCVPVICSVPGQCHMHG